MSAFRLILLSLTCHWRMHTAVGLGVAAGTAVLTGALLVGDSMTGSLRDLTLGRLGRIDTVLVTQRFFRAELAEELGSQPAVRQHFRQVVPAILLRATVEAPGSGARANQINLVGCQPHFWGLGTGGPDEPVADGRVVINRPLADRLGVQVGDRVMLRLPRISPIPADNPLGRKRDTVASHGLYVQAILPAEGLGRFSLRPSQQRPLNAYVALEWLQRRLGKPGQVNTLLVAGHQADRPAPAVAERALQAALRPQLADFGIRVARTPRGYFNITSDRMLLAPEVEGELLRALAGEEIQPAFTYLATTIACGDREIPYSTITAIDFRPDRPLGPWVTAEGDPIPALRRGQIVLNRWAADRLAAQVGDAIQLTYFEPESRDGQVRERTSSFRLAAVAELAEAADDPALTPEVAGVTDRLKMTGRDGWDPPFPFDANRVGDEDERYWEEHRATPKAFVCFADGRRLWSSRFGGTTSLRVRPREGLTVAGLAERLRLDPAKLGFVFQPVKRQGLEASRGTTPFNALFLGFSFFVIAAAVMLVALLFRLGVDGRAAQVGLLLAVGTSGRQVSRLLVAEGLIVAAVASVVGVAAGFGYAALMLAGLRTWWLAAVVTPFLRLHWSAGSLAVGYASGVLVAGGAIAWSVRRIERVSPRQLLAGQVEDLGWHVARPARWPGIASLLALAAAVASGVAALALGEQARVGAFFGSGTLVLIAACTWTWFRLRSGATGAAVAPGRGNLLRMALRNAARNPRRSALAIGLVAAACFLIVSVSAFHLDPATQAPAPDSGNGGFALVAESAQPIYQDLNTPDGRFDLGFSDEASATLDRATVYALRVKRGEDASCLNLYQPREPTMLGVPEAFIRRGGFAFGAHQAGTPAEEENPWLLLQKRLPPDSDRTPRVPVIIDDATAKYSLHLWKGVGQTLDLANGRGGTIRLVVVGLLKNSIFQGTLLLSDAQLLAHFPELAGFRFFLVEAQPEDVRPVRNALETALGDYGLAAETTGRRLAGFLAVQNTYLSTFQTLGGLGLLLGTFGLAAVQVRNVLERRRELALLRATGFRRGTLAWMVMLENGLLLLLGLALGCLAALVAVFPHLMGGAATIPWGPLAATLLAVLAGGLFAGLAAVRATLQAPLLAALRGE